MGRGLVAGVDIGGTQCSVNLGRASGGELELVARDQFPTRVGRGPEAVLAEIVSRLRQAIAQASNTTGVSGAGAPGQVAAIGVSCGGPLSSETGLVQSPPNLPGWDDVPVVKLLSEALDLPCFLENDANASALAEWQFGSAVGCDHVVFMTFGTGLGAGLILDGRLYRGRRGLAGELGHWRAGPDEGPVHYGKAGSLEAFCSGSGIVGWYEHLSGAGGDGPKLSAQAVAQRAREGDALAKQVFNNAASNLGLAIALIADLLAPDVVVVGGIFGYAHDLLREGMFEELAREAHPAIREQLQVLPAGLGERLGSYASCCVALEGLASITATSAAQTTSVQTTSAGYRPKIKGAR